MLPGKRSRGAILAVTTKGLGFEIENYKWQGMRIPGTVVDITVGKSSERIFFRQSPSSTSSARAYPGRREKRNAQRGLEVIG
jgi:hypothetical protein